MISKKIQIFGDESWTIEEIQELLKFLQSPIGKKIHSDIRSIAVRLDKSSMNKLSQASMDSPASSLYGMLKDRDLSNMLLMLGERYFNFSVLEKTFLREFYPDEMEISQED